MLITLFCAIVVPSRAQTAKPAVSSHPQAADTAARKQLAAYLADFKSNPQNATLHQEIGKGSPQTLNTRLRWFLCLLGPILPVPWRS